MRARPTRGDCYGSAYLAASSGRHETAQNADCPPDPANRPGPWRAVEELAGKSWLRSVKIDRNHRGASGYLRLAPSVMSIENLAMKAEPHQLEPGAGNGLIAVVAMPVAV